MNVEDSAFLLGRHPLTPTFSFVGLVILPMVLSPRPRIVDRLTHNLDDLVAFQGLDGLLSNEIIRQPSSSLIGVIAAAPPSSPWEQTDRASIRHSAHAPLPAHEQPPAFVIGQ